MSTIAEFLGSLDGRAFVDGEAALADVLRAALDPTPVVGKLPDDPPYPIVRVQRISGSPSSTLPTFLDSLRCQVDVYADSKAVARSIVDRARYVCAQLANVMTPHGLIAGAALNAEAYDPDFDFVPPKDRYRFDVTIGTRVGQPPAGVKATNQPEGETLP